MYEVAKEILRQLGGPGRLRAMIGAETFLAEKYNDNRLGIKFKAKAKHGINFIKITLTPADLYDVEFSRVHDCKVISTLKGIYAEDLKRLIELETGLYLSL